MQLFYCLASQQAHLYVLRGACNLPTEALNFTSQCSDIIEKDSLGNGSISQADHCKLLLPMDPEPLDTRMNAGQVSQPH